MYRSAIVAAATLQPETFFDPRKKMMYKVSNCLSNINKYKVIDAPLGNVYEPSIEMRNMPPPKALVRSTKEQKVADGSPLQQYIP
jgi:hypothetical protein